MLYKLKKLWKRFWTPTVKVGIVLKSGKEIVVFCTEYTFKADGDQIKSYNFKGIIGTIPQIIVINEIAAVIQY